MCLTDYFDFDGFVRRLYHMVMGSPTPWVPDQDSFRGPSHGDRLRILLGSDYFPPLPSGIGEHVAYLAEYLRARGHHVDVVTSGTHHPTSDPPYVYRIGRTIPIPINQSIGRITFSPRLLRRLAKILEYPYDILHLHPPLSPSIPLALLHLSQTLNVGTFHAAHRNLFLYNVFQNFLERYTKKLHGRIAVSSVAMESVARYFPGTYTFIPNGVDVRRFHPDLPPIPWMKDSPAFHVLFVGRFEPRKGLIYLIRAMYLLRKQIPDMRLVVVGDGPLRTFYLRETQRLGLGDRVVFVGRVAREHLPRYYASADVFVSPATGAESFGIVLIEAQACGTPVIASRIPGYAQVIRHGVNGILVPPRSPRSLARALIHLYKNPAERKRLRHQALTVVRNRYAWDVVAAQVEAFYYEVVFRFRVKPDENAIGGRI